MEYTINISDDELHEEFFWFLEHPGKCVFKSRHNKIIKYFQQDILYKTEKQLLNDPNILEKLISNRCKYLSKSYDELTTLELIDGFKKSGIYYGYSMFNPLLAKWFFEKYNCNSCYDPCGGWGHRLLGATELDLYIYNDISTDVANNVRNICEYFDIPNTKIYNNNSIGFIPDEDYDAVFTCPPYMNIEIYNNKMTEDEYAALLDSIVNSFLLKDCCNVCGMVIREDLFPSKYNHLISEKILLHNPSAKHFHNNNKHKYDEYLFILIKN